MVAVRQASDGLVGAQRQHTVDELPEEHSPLGGSGGHRWIPCPGSVRMSAGHSDSESEFAAEGTAAHVLADTCLTLDDDAWEYIGQWVTPQQDFYAADDAKPDDAWEVDKEMADAVQVFLDSVRTDFPNRNQGNSWVERFFYCPSVHPAMYGRSDFNYLERIYEPTGVVEQGHIEEQPRHRLHVRDYKHGVGIVVAAEENVQLMYYGVGMLEDLQLWDSVDEVVLSICQPRGWMDPLREWTISVEDLKKWRDEVMIPAMDLAIEVSRDTSLSGEDLVRLGLLVSGEHCRFCPARFAVCPRHVSDEKRIKELMELIEEKGGAPKATNEEIGEFLSLFDVMKIRQKAYRETGYIRAETGATVPGWKLVNAKKNRVYRNEDGDGKNIDVKQRAKNKFGAKRAMTTPELKSPAQLDLLPGGKAFTAEYAYKPEGGQQLVPASEARAESGPKKKAMFQPQATKEKVT